ncbi:MAG: Na+/H+ antiporter subunit E, partial [Nitrospirales bacterium]
AFPLVRFLAYVPWLFSRIVRSSLHLTYLILHPRMPIEPMLVPYRPQLRDKTAVTVLGNSITLTPGTVTAEVSRQGLLVHAMDQDSMSDLVSGRLERRIARVFRRIETG